MSIIDKTSANYVDAPESANTSLMINPNTEDEDKQPVQKFIASERDLLVTLLDAVLALSDRLFPDERMEVEVRGTVNGEPSFSYVSSSTLTHWVKR